MVGAGIGLDWERGWDRECYHKWSGTLYTNLARFVLIAKAYIVQLFEGSEHSIQMSHVLIVTVNTVAVNNC